MLGLMMWIFREKHIAGFLDMSPTVALVKAMSVLLFPVGLGFCMDNKVFRISRMQERSDGGRSHKDAAASTMHSTRRTIVAAAVLMSTVVLGLIGSSLSFVNLLVVGLTVAVLLDAFVIWGLLVPSVISLMEEAGSWVARLRHQQPTPRPAERYKIDPQFVLRALERLS
jgi:uncharacterized membrane protein YdfJ with MMPL/SSD domain